MNKKQISLLLGIMCFCLTIGICIQIKTVKRNNETYDASTGVSTSTNDLRDRVIMVKEQYKSSYAKLETLEQELEALRTKATENSNAPTDEKAKLEEYNRILGFTELKGQGITITLNDAQITEENIFDMSLKVVHDEDLVQVVNALKNAGAEAIAINGQRIVSTTGITCVGNVVKIDGEKVSVPFIIDAIGSPSKLYYSLEMNGGYIWWMKEDGIKVEIKENYNITIPKYEGVYNSEYMKRIEE